MNLKTLLIIIIGITAFLGIYLFSMVGALGILLGFGLGVLCHDYITDIFKNYQRKIYLSEKEDMINRKKQIISELEKIEKETKGT
jgi:uncharacterized membrane protein